MGTFVKNNPPEGIPMRKATGLAGEDGLRGGMASQATSLLRPSTPTTAYTPAEYNEASAAPQVTIQDGRLMIDVASLSVARPTSSDASTFERVEETGRRITSSSFRRPKRVYGNSHSNVSASVASTTGEEGPQSIANLRWGIKETFLFYEALAMIGTDFEMIASFLPGRTREHVKAKFKREERQDPLRIAKALTEKRPFNPTHLKALVTKSTKKPSLKKSPSKKSNLA